jgi:hypothetical protein
VGLLVHDGWCAKSRDGWCLLKPNRKPCDGAFQVRTKCEHFICLPGGFAKREPTCPDCRKLSERK